MSEWSKSTGHVLTLTKIVKTRKVF